MAPKAIVAALVALALGLVAGLLIGRAGGADLPGDDSVEAGFARDMQTHHDQAVEMSWIIRDRTDDESVRTIAYDIARTQENQSGQMAGWLQSWGLRPTGSQPTMAWMEGSHAGHTTGAGGDEVEMPGMASAADLDRLRSLSGTEAEIWYLQIMIRHHLGGVPMAEAVLARSQTPEVDRLAQSIIDSQSAEVDTMTAMLEERDAEPLPA